MYGKARLFSPGDRRPVAAPRRVVVVGGGLAGTAAAVVLAEHGVTVTLLERERVLGGRVSAWRDQLADGTPFEMDRGFHAFFRQYHNLRSLLRRIDPALRMLRPLDDYPLLGPNGERESFSRLPKTPPLNLAALVWRTPTIGWRDLRAMDGVAGAEMLRFDMAGTYDRLDHQSASEYLDALGMPAQARRMLFEVFAHSFFNREDQLSAAELIAMFHLYFLGSSDGILFDTCDEPFSDALWTPLGRLLDQLGVDVRTGTTIDEVERYGDGWSVGDERADGVVLAVPVEPLQAIVAASPAVGDESWRADVGALEVAPPFVVWRLWLDRPLARERAPFAGTAGMGILDNVSLLHEYQGEARRWAARTGGSVIELHAYALPDFIAGDTGAPSPNPGFVHDAAHMTATRTNAGESEAARWVRDELMARLHALYPETREARVVDERWLLRQDCPAFPPGSAARRPGTVTPSAGVVLAGDHVAIPLPTALMERATTSGMLAANHLLRGWGGGQEAVWSVPLTGLLARRAKRRSA